MPACVAVARASIPAWRDDPLRRRAARRIEKDCGRRTCRVPRRAPRIGERHARRPRQADPRHSGCARRGRRASAREKGCSALSARSDSPAAIATASGSSNTRRLVQKLVRRASHGHPLSGPAGCWQGTWTQSSEARLRVVRSYTYLRVRTRPTVGWGHERYVFDRTDCACHWSNTRNWICDRAGAGLTRARPWRSAGATKTASTRL